MVSSREGKKLLSAQVVIDFFFDFFGNFILAMIYVVLQAELYLQRAEDLTTISEVLLLMFVMTDLQYFLAEKSPQTTTVPSPSASLVRLLQQKVKEFSLLQTLIIMLLIILHLYSSVYFIEPCTLYNRHTIIFATAQLHFLTFCCSSDQASRGAWNRSWSGDFFLRENIANQSLQTLTAEPLK